MSKTKLFLENFFAYGLGGVVGKIIPVIMLPIITRLFPNASYFGINDNTNLIVSIASYIAIMGMYDAMYRMFFESEEEIFQKKVCSTTFAYTFLVSIVLTIIMLVFSDSISKLCYKDSNLSYLVIVAAFSMLVGSTNTIVAGPARMRNKKLVYILMNSLIPLLTYAFALIWIFNGYYIIALPIAALISSIINEIVFIIYNKEWFKIKYIDYKLLKPLLKFAIPLLPNFLIYWIFSASDKMMITHILNLDESGLYGIGSKLGMVSQLIYTAFASGWQYFAYSTMKDKNQVKDNSKLFEYLAIISMIFTIFIAAISYNVYDLFFEEEYIGGAIVSPYLFLAPLCQMLFQVAISQFAIIKKTWPNMIFLSLGAIVNVVLNLVLIPIIGIEGAAIATLTGYVVSVIICVGVLLKKKMFVIEKRFIFLLLIFILVFVLWRIFASQNIFLGMLFLCIQIIVTIIIYKKDVCIIWHKLKKK